jgi:hypothetical protein
VAFLVVAETDFSAMRYILAASARQALRCPHDEARDAGFTTGRCSVRPQFSEDDSTTRIVCYQIEKKRVVFDKTIQKHAGGRCAGSAGKAGCDGLPRQVTGRQNSKADAVALHSL